MDHEEDFKCFEEGSLNIEERSLNIVPVQNAAKVLDAPIVGQTFGSWEELDCFISLYARSQNFASVIRGSEYSEGVCRNPRAIWYTSKLINNFLDLELQQSDLTGQLDITEQTDSIESLNSFIEDSVDAPAILAKELILSSEIESVLEIWEWYTNKKQLESELQTRQQPFIIGVNNNNADGTNPKQSFPHASFCLPSVSFSEVHRKVNYRKTYVMINGLSKKAIQTGLDVGTNAIQELEDFMNGSHELEGKNKNSKEHLEIAKGRKPTQCKQCQNTGHNRASCEAWHQWQGIPYSY
ncbi:hypothetical protein F8M41_001781 [Gigaspora margarita]|uniref:Uncharacterized protein n=1 Tax=Gigaspora margarita TaxID=4874 RepID=A0A8H4A7I1_GIGMA|nr:hypothetical protein F8M41_001781 [Gigaspora margarita]